jgi:hypothetical protein
MTTDHGKRQNALNDQQWTSRRWGNRITRGWGTIKKKHKSLLINWNGPSNQMKTTDSPWRIQEAQIKQIPPVTLKEILNAIKVNIHLKKAPGFDLIRGEILKQLPEKAIVKLTYLYNAAFQSDYDTETRKACYWSYLLQTNIATTGTVETVRNTTTEKIETYPGRKADHTNPSVWFLKQSFNDRPSTQNNYLNRKDTRGETGLLLYFLTCGPSIW